MVQTGFLRELAGNAVYVMLILNGSLRGAHVDWVCCF